MLVAWMLYAILLGAPIAAGALALERLVAVWGGARRVVWIGALFAAMVAPAGAALRRGPRLAPSPRPVGIVPTDLPLFDGNALASSGPIPSRNRAMVVLHRLRERADMVLASSAAWHRYAAMAWAAASAGLLALLGVSMWSIRRQRRAWRPAELEGLRILVAKDAGPAVVGAIRPAIVLPEWALSLDAGERTLMLRHESEHVAAGDPWLLLIAGLSLVLLPWHAALWFITKRLRQAIEIDCDARVLRAVDRPREYGHLLLTVGARSSRSLPYAAALVERHRSLERRILAMTAVRPTRPVLVSIPLFALAGIAATLAAQMPRPARLAAPLPGRAGRIARDAVRLDAMPAARSESWFAEDRALPTSESATSKAAQRHAKRVNGDSTILSDVPVPPTPPRRPARALDVPLEVLRAWVARYHPSLLLGDTSANMVTFLVDANEQYVRSIAMRVPGPVGPTTKDILDTIPRDDIAHVEVMKGPAAAALYGAAAVNGVVLIETKQEASPVHTDSVRVDSIARGAGGVGVMRGRIGGPGNPLMAAMNSPIVQDSPLFIVDGQIVSPPPVSRTSCAGNCRITNRDGSNPFSQLGVRADEIQSVEVVRFAAGQFGPGPLGIFVVKLK